MSDTYNSLLNDYLKYDYLNKDSKRPLIKILVSYIKPSFLFKSEILTPIQLGKAVEKTDSKDGVQSEENIKWLHENCEFNDDFEGGISKYNRRIGFLTGTYWAWKHYESLGNPEYFGSFGYRKLLPANLMEYIKDYDVFAPKKFDLAEGSVKKQFIYSHGEKIYDCFYNVFQTVFPEDIKLLEEYLDKPSAYFHELYIMKKDIFFDYCEWIFKYLFKFLELYPTPIEIDTYHIEMTSELKQIANFLEISEDKFKKNFEPQTKGKEIRDMGFVLERLTGFYLYKLSKNNNVKFFESEFIDFSLQNKYDIRKELLKKMRSNVKNKLK